jgi:hypothetical protein
MLVHLTHCYSFSIRSQTDTCRWESRAEKRAAKRALNLAL